MLRAWSYMDTREITRCCCLLSFNGSTSDTLYPERGSSLAFQSRCMLLASTKCIAVVASSTANRSVCLGSFQEQCRDAPYPCAQICRTSAQRGYNSTRDDPPSLGYSTVESIVVLPGLELALQTLVLMNHAPLFYAARLLL